MIREARGFYERGKSLTAAPIVRIGMGFGRDRVVAVPALVDTGSDVCVFPRELVPSQPPWGPTMDVLVDGVGGVRFPTTAFFPSVTAGDIRIPGVATVLLLGAQPILGRSFLNACEVHLSAERGTVVLRRKGGRE